MAQRQRTHRTPAITRLEGNYGPEGMTLLSAAIMWGLAGVLVGFLGIVLLFSSGDHGSLLTAGYALLCVGILLELSSVARAVQAVYSGRRFRNGRPFVRRQGPT